MAKRNVNGWPGRGILGEARISRSNSSSIDGVVGINVIPQRGHLPGLLLR
jgi:hypothetical protein